MPVDLFSEYYRWTVTSGGTDAPVAGTSQTWTVTSSTGAPLASNAANPPSQFRVVDAADTNVPPEVMLVTNVSGTTWTATRGAESGAVWAHASGWTAIPVLTATAVSTLASISGVATPLTTPMHDAMASWFVPWNIGGWYANPMAKGNRTTAIYQQFSLHPFFSGPDGCTIDQLSTYVSTAASVGSGAVVRAGVYRVNNQARPFANVMGATNWATLLRDAGTLSTESTGSKLWTLAPALVIPPNTWFAVGGVEGGATGAIRYISQYVVGAWTPWGAATQDAYQIYPNIALVINGVSATVGLPTTYVNSAGFNVDSGIAMHRSA